jgi:uncharacterized protein
VGNPLIVLDTSAIIALADTRQSEHAALAAVADAQRGPFVVPAGILGEVGYLLETRLKHKALDTFLDDLEEGTMQLDCGERDLPRIRALVARYADLPLGFADAAVIACAERRAATVLSLDRDVAIVAREGSFSVLPG